MASWVNVGVLLFEGFQETPRPAVLRTEMESGPPKQLEIKDSTLLARPVVYQFTSAEYSQFVTWFQDTISKGADFFDWLDPVDQQTKQVRIVEGAYQASPVNPHLANWRVSFTLESYG